MLSFPVDRNSREPLYRQVKANIIRQIEEGLLAPGDRLPATRDLAEQLGIARISVVAAYEELKDEGYLGAHVGKGTFVLPREADSSGPAAAAALTGTLRPQSPVLRDLMRMAERPGVINFGQGVPAEVLLPVDLIRGAIDAVLARDGGSALAYEDPEGYPPLREGIARRLRGMGITAPPERILITGGCQQALDLAVQALLNPGDVLLTSNPTYAGMLDITRARGVIPVGVPLDKDGMQTALLEHMIVEHRPRLLYIAPTYHNPTGTVMPLGRRRQLLDIAARHRLPVLEDGVYEDVTYAGTPPPPLCALDREDLVMYASSFSKVLLPGIRVGYLVVGERLYRRIARVKGAADICTPALNQRAIHLALVSGQIDEHLARVRSVFHARRDAMLVAVQRHLPFAHCIEPAGGLYLWLALPEDGPTSTELYLSAVARGAAFALGPLFYTDSGGVYHLRLNMVVYPPDKIEEGVRRLGQAWHDLASGARLPADVAAAPFL